MTQPNKHIRTIAITGGKGGVGKTHTAINLSCAMARQGHSVLLMDADLGLSNVDILLGLQPKRDLSDVLYRGADLEEVLIDSESGFKILPGASGLQNMAQLDALQIGGLIQGFSSLSNTIDTLIVDSAAGIQDTNLRFAQSCQEVLVVVCNEPTSLTDAYALIKILSTQYGVKRFRVVSNMVQSNKEGRELFAKLSSVTNNFLRVPLHYLGSIPEDAYVKKAIRAQKLLMDMYPGSKCAQAFQALAVQLDKLPVVQSASGQMEFFIEQFTRVHEAGVGP